MWTSTGDVEVKVCGDDLKVPANELTVDKIRSIAKEHGLSQFIVKVNGEDVESPSDFDGVSSGDIVQIVPYDLWG